MRAYKVIILIMTTVLIGGCSSLSEAPTHYYVLTPIEQGTELSKTYPELRINVRAVRIPPYLDKPSIVSRNSKNTLHISAGHRWGGKLRKSLARIMAQNLSTLLATPNVVIAPNSTPTLPDYILEIRILQFERNKEMQVQLKAQWRLVKGKNLSPILTRITHLTGEIIDDEKNYDATVASMSKLFGDLSKIIAQNLKP